MGVELELFEMLISMFRGLCLYIFVRFTVQNVYYMCEQTVKSVFIELHTTTLISLTYIYYVFITLTHSSGDLHTFM